MLSVHTNTVQRFSRAGPRGRAREWATLGVHPLSWLLSNNRLEEVCGTLTKGTFSSRLLLSNQDKGCTPGVAHSLPLPLPPGFCSICQATICGRRKRFNQFNQFLIKLRCNATSLWRNKLTDSPTSMIGESCSRFGDSLNLFRYIELFYKIRLWESYLKSYEINRSIKLIILAIDWKYGRMARLCRIKFQHIATYPSVVIHLAFQASVPGSIPTSSSLKRKEYWDFLEYTDTMRKV